MKNLIVALVIMIAVSTASIAQGRRGGGERMPPEKRAEMQTKRMTEELGLNADQQQKLLALNTERIKKSQELGREETEKRREIREGYEKDLKAILTPEQQEKLKEARREGRGPRGDAGRTGDAPSGGRKRSPAPEK